MTNTYYSIVKFTDAVLKKYPNAGTIILPFVPERQTQIDMINTILNQLQLS